MSVPPFYHWGQRLRGRAGRGAGAVTGIQGFGPVRNLLSPFGKSESEVMDLLVPGGILQPSGRMKIG